MIRGPIRVLVVDDSRAARHLIAAAIDKIDGVELAGEAEDGIEGLAAIERLDPDVITLDIEMPRMTGLEMLDRLRAKRNDVPVIMLSVLTHKGASATLSALSRGASDFLPKPSSGGSLAKTLLKLRDDLGEMVIRLHQARRRRIERTPRTRPTTIRPHPAPLSRQAARPSSAPLALLIGSSTGGPAALETLLKGLCHDYPLPIVVVQHMPAAFTALLAERLDDRVPLRVSEGRADQQIGPGEVVIAPGGAHLVLTGLKAGKLVLGLDDRPPVNFTKPSVDVMLESAAPVLGARAIVAILTGMGTDGCEGAIAMHELGAPVFAQDEASSVVWGMPGAVAKAGISAGVLPISRLPGAIETMTYDLLHGGSAASPTFRLREVAS